MRPSTTLAAALLLALPVAPLMAHDLWLEHDASGHTLLHGHRHSEHAGAETLSYDPAIFRAAHCLDRGGVTPRTAVRAYPLRIRGECPVLLVELSSGYWSKTAWETRNAPRDQTPGAMKSWLSQESVKRIERWLPEAAQPIGDGLELVPAEDPLHLKPGDKLTVTVMENRKPRAGVNVAYQGRTRGTSGADGRVNIRLRQGGMQFVSASSETPMNDGKADVAIRATTLQFELAP